VAGAGPRGGGHGHTGAQTHRHHIQR